MFIITGTGHVALHMQTTELESTEVTFKDVTKQFSRPPTIIVNSAGITLFNNLMNTSKDFDEIVNVNLKGTFLVMQTAVKAIVEADATKGIRVNAVLPSLIETPMTSIITDSYKQIFLKLTSLGRAGQPQEVAEVIAFLASDKSSYVSEAAIEITGGRL